jgi:DNA-binding NarL/FixJ family response regulator
VERTRIVLIDMSPLLREIVRGVLKSQPDLEVVGEHDAVVDVRETVERDDADFVIVGTDAAAETCMRSVVGAGLGVRALEVRSDGRECVLYELRPHRVPLGEISPATLLSTIRAVPTWEGRSADATI